MAFISCKLYKIPASRFEETKNLLSKKGSRQYAESWGYKLNFIVRPAGHISESDYGVLADVYFDQVVQVSQLDPDTFERKSEPAKQTQGPVTVFLYSKKPMELILGVFTNNADAEQMRKIINGLIAPKEQPLAESITYVRFLLNEKEAAIKSIPGFGQVSEVSIDDINDMNVDSVWLKGSNVDRAPEYNKYFTERGGQIRFLTLLYKERNYYFIEDGRIFTRQGGDSHDEYSMIYDLVTKLTEKNAVKW